MLTDVVLHTRVPRVDAVEGDVERQPRVAPELDERGRVPCSRVDHGVEGVLDVTQVKIPTRVSSRKTVRDEEVVDRGVGALGEPSSGVVLGCAVAQLGAVGCPELLAELGDEDAASVAAYPARRGAMATDDAVEDGVEHLGGGRRALEGDELDATPEAVSDHEDVVVAVDLLVGV